MFTFCKTYPSISELNFLTFFCKIFKLLMYFAAVSGNIKMKSKSLFVCFFALLIGVANTAFANTISGFLTMSDGANIYYETAGEGYPLIMLHGGEYVNGRCKGSTSWDPQFSYFSNFYQVVRLDMRHCGQSSDTGPNPFNTFEWSSNPQRITLDAVEVMQQLGIERAHVLGLSIGSAIAAQIGAFYPEMINHLILASLWRDNTLPRDDSQLQALINIITTAYIIGGYDDPQHWYELSWAESHNYIPESVAIPGGGHFVNRDRPTQFNNYVLSFLSSPIPEPTTFFLLIAGLLSLLRISVWKRCSLQ